MNGEGGGENMRKRERRMKDQETIDALLQTSPVGRLATVNAKGFPVIKPVNFIYWDGKIYVHSSLKGEKVADIRRGSPVCFEIEDPVAYVAALGASCSANYYYRSIIAKGAARLVSGQKKKREVLDRLMRKYQPEGGSEGFPDEILRKTAVIEIFIEEMTGKEKLG
jgi:uncharacterized protein